MQHRHRLGIALALAILGIVREAGATPNFPDELESHYGLTSLPGSPPCLLCHSGPAGGKGTATTPFGAYLRSRGAQSYDAASLRAALDADRGENHDSDGNGLSDYEDLRDGRNPNGSADVPEQPRYGCVQAPASGAANGALGFMALALLALGVIARRLKRSTQRALLAAGSPQA